MASNSICGGRAVGIAVGIPVLVLLMAGSAGAATLTVDNGSNSIFSKIRNAVNNSSLDAGQIFQSDDKIKSIVQNERETKENGKKNISVPPPPLQNKESVKNSFGKRLCNQNNCC